MDTKKILSTCDHTLLLQTAAWEDIKKICDEGMQFGTASVCIPPAYVKQAKEYVKDKLKICTVIGFPNGYNTTAVKVFETEQAILEGADEIDMVINIGWLKAKCDTQVRDEIRSIKAACGEKVLKVIIETCLLTEEEKVRMCHIVTEAGADYIKNGGLAGAAQMGGGGVGLGVAAQLHYRKTLFGKSRGNVAHGGGLADAAFSIDSDTFHGVTSL